MNTRKPKSLKQKKKKKKTLDMYKDPDKKKDTEILRTIFAQEGEEKEKGLEGLKKFEELEENLDDKTLEEGQKNDEILKNRKLSIAIANLLSKTEGIPDTYRDQKLRIETATSLLLKNLATLPTNKDKVLAIKNFEDTCTEACKQIPNTLGTNILKAVTAVIGAAAGFVVGAIVGAGLGALAGGVVTPAAIFTSLIGLVKGSITGAALGIAASSALFATTGAHCGYKLFDSPLAKMIDNVTTEAHKVVKKRPK